MQNNLQKQPGQWSIYQRKKGIYEFGILQPKMKLAHQEPSQVFRQSGHPVGTSCLGETLQERQVAAKPYQKRFLWRDILKLLDNFKEIGKVNVKSGTSCFIWTDMWNDPIPSLSYPELYSFAKNKNKLATIVFPAKSGHFINSFDHLSLSEIAFSQLLNMEQTRHNVVLA